MRTLDDLEADWRALEARGEARSAALASSDSLLEEARALIVRVEELHAQAREINERCAAEMRSDVEIGNALKLERIAIDHAWRAVMYTDGSPGES